MSMVMELHAIPEKVADFLIANPGWIHRVIFGDEPVEQWPPAKPGLMARLFGAKPAKKVVEPLPPQLSQLENESEYLDKAWHGIHYLLCGEAWAEDEEEAARHVEQWLLYGGEPVGEEDVGYGPARILHPDQVVKWSEFLGRYSEEDLRARFNPEDMMKKEIYPSIWDRDPEEDDTLGYILEYFPTLRDFVAKQAAAGKAIIFVLC